MTVERLSLLIVTESFEVGGLETYISGQAKAMIAEGWAVHLACGSEPTEQFVPVGLSSTTTSLCLRPDATLADLVGTVESLRSVIRDRAVTHVHGHPFISLFPAMLAASLEGVPFIQTLHGPSSLTTGYGPVNDFLLTALILPLSQCVIAVSDEVMELAAPYVKSSSLFVQRNAIDFARFKPSEIEDADSSGWLLISRLDSQKITGIRAFVNQMSQLGVRSVDIVGDGPGRVILQDWLQKDGVDHVVRFLGIRSDVSRLMHSYAGVAGMGRVLLEAAASGKPVCMVGYDGVKGLLDQDLFKRAAYANFSGRNLPNVDVLTLADQVETIRQRNLAEIAAAAFLHHSEDAVWPAFAKRIALLTCNAHASIRGIYSVLRSEEAIAQPGAYLQSEDLFYRLGRVLHGSQLFVPTLSASYAFYASRMREHREAMLHNEARLEVNALASRCDERLSEETSRVLEDLKILGLRFDQNHVDLFEAVQLLKISVEDAARVEPPLSFLQRLLNFFRRLLKHKG